MFNPDNPQDVSPTGKANAEKGEEAFAPSVEVQNLGNDEKVSWWPNCVHARYSKLAVRKFRDRIVILWKCRKCPKEVREVIDIDMNSREVFTKSTKSALPKRFQPSEE